MNTENQNHTDPMDDFLKEAIQTSGLEKPEKDFIPSLMEKIEQEERLHKPVVRAKPTIPAIGWVIIVSLTVLVYALVFFSGQSTLHFPLLSSWFNKVSLDFLSFSIPNIFLVGLFAFLFYFVLEILFISRHYRGERFINQK